MTLLTASELAAVRGVAESGMETTCTILTRATVVTDDGQESVWATSALDVPCWIKQITGDASTLDGISGAVGIAQLVNIRLAVGTDVRAGDEIAVGSTIYTVQAGNQDDTYAPWWEFACRVIE